MERCLHYVRIVPGTKSEFDRLHAEIPSEITLELAESGLHDVTGFRRGTDVWRYAEAEPDRETAFGLYARQPASRARSHQFRGVIAEIEAPEGGLIWYDEIFHTDAPAPDGPFERGLFSLVIDPDGAGVYDELHANPWPEMIDAIHAAGYRNYTGFRRGAHVVYFGHYYPDFRTVIARINATEVAARWGQALDGVITTIAGADGHNFTANETYHLD